MQTQYGALSTLTGVDGLTKLLKHDKHQLLEGLVFQSWMEDCIDVVAPTYGMVRAGIEVFLAWGYPLVDCAYGENTALKNRLRDLGGAATWNPQRKLWCVRGLTADDLPCDLPGAVVCSQRHAFVWVLREDALSESVVTLLDKHFAVHSLQFDAAAEDFICVSTSQNGSSSSKGMPLQEILGQLTSSTPNFEPPAREVRDSIRQDTAIAWLQNKLPSESFRAVVLKRVLANFEIQPFFKRLVDIDVLLQHQAGQTSRWLVLEAKHKFPETRDHTAGPYFGLNEIELRAANALADCGASSGYLVFVKPVWNDRVSTVEVLSDDKLRNYTHVLYRALDSDYLVCTKKLPKSKSGGNTTITRRGTVGYRPLPLSDFSRLGDLSMSDAEVGARIFESLLGQGSFPKATLDNIPRYQGAR